LSQNELDDTATLPRYEDGEPTVELPKITTNTAELPRVKVHVSMRELMHYLLSSRLIQSLLIGNGFVLIACIGLSIGYMIAMEAGVVPNPVPGIARGNPAPEASKTPEHKENRRTPSATASPSDWIPVAEPAARKTAADNASTEAKPSAPTSASPSDSASASAQPETSASVTQPASPETAAPATTPSATAPTSTESSPAAEPTSSGPETPGSPTGETPSSNPGTADPAVTP